MRLAAAGGVIPQVHFVPRRPRWDPGQRIQGATHGDICLIHILPLRGWNFWPPRGRLLSFLQRAQSFSPEPLLATGPPGCSVSPGVAPGNCCSPRQAMSPGVPGRANPAPPPPSEQRKQKLKLSGPGAGGGSCPWARARGTRVPTGRRPQKQRAFERRRRLPRSGYKLSYEAR